ncbi:Zinc finger protein 638 [Microtus ochrogaster]|uniref:Zinc finger protein 638 n=1 Tax=Microtus ochrogaster TaxID=79684 RepID=A0A8J6KWA4_MICOH|nr:Zinc finger protein 638 [Microtus ochrogaster]
MDFHEAQQKKEKPHSSRWDDEPHITPPVEVKQSSVTQVTEQSPKVQSRYTKESASSILASFGLSNEDLEELSRYPDEQLTPENMPLILRDIRMRKMGRRLPNLPSHSRNKETLGKETVSSNVIDYGHASKYGYTEDPLEVRIYDPEIPTDEVKNEYRSQENISATVPSPNVTRNSVFPVEDVFRQMDFPGESSSQSFFPAESGTKMTGLHISGQSVLEPVKSVSQSLSQTVSQTMSQSLVTPSVNQPSFSSELISALNQQERIPQKPVISSDDAHVGPRGSKKSYQSEADLPIRSPFGIVKASWLPKFTQAGTQKMKRLPTPSMMNDYYAASPRIFPHLCSLCNVECSHLKDWIQHQNTSTHIESCRQLRQQLKSSQGSLPCEMRAIGKKMKLQEDVLILIPPVLGILGDQAQVTDTIDLEVQLVIDIDQGVEVQEFAIVSFLNTDPDPDPVLHIEAEISLEEVQSPTDRKKAVEDGGQRSVHGTEVTKQKNIEAVDKGFLPAQKPKLASGTKPSVKSVSSMESDSHLEHAAHKYRTLEDDTLPEGKQVSGKGAFIQRKIRPRKDLSLSSNSVLLVSELPEDGFTEEDIRKAFHPFGNINDILLVPCRNEAYLEMEYKKAVTAVMRHTETIPLEIKGKIVKVCVPGRKKAQEMEEMSVVFISNLPNKGYSTEEIYNLAKPFGSLKDVLILLSHQKAYIEINKKYADSMVKFYTSFPVSMDGNQLSINMAPEDMDIKDEAQTESDPELGKESTFSPDLKNSPVDESEVQTAADSPSVKPSEIEEETTCNIETETSVQQEELGKEEPKQDLYESDFAIETLDLEAQGAEVSIEIPLVASTPAKTELFSENMEESALNQQIYTSDFVKEETEVTNPETELSISDSVLEEKNIKGILEDSPSEADKSFSGIAQPTVEAIAEVDKHETVSEVLPSACVATQEPGSYIEDEKVVSKNDTSEKISMDDKQENEFNTKETRMDLQVETEKSEKNEADTFVEKLEKIIAAIREKPVESAVIKADPNKGVGESSNPDETGKTSVPTVSNVCNSKTSIKATVVSSTKAKNTTSKTESQKNFPKPVLRDQIIAEKKVSAKEFGLLKNTRSDLTESNSKSKPTQSGVSRGRITALQCKDSKLDYKDIAKQSQETETKPPSMKRDDSNNKEPLFTFNLDEFVTVDEVIEEVTPSQAKQNQLKGKRKEALKISPSPELNLKKKKGETSVPHSVEGELSFVTLDEIGEEEDAAAQALVTVDEVIDEEELNMEEMVKNSNSLLTLDELIDQDDCISHSESKDVTVLSMAEEQDLQQERLVTVDEIGEVEESADIPFATLNSKRDEGTTVRDSIGFISSQVPEDPSTLVTVDEIQDDRSDFHLVTLDEVTEEDEDSLADFKNLKEELNFVTVDEVGDEEDGDNDSKVELAQGKIDHHPDKKGNRKRRAVGPKKTKLDSFSQVGPGSETVTKDLKTMIERPTAAKTPMKRVRIGKASPSQKAVMAEPAKGKEAFQMNEGVEEAELNDSEPDEKRKKTEDSPVGKSVTADVPEDLDFLVPKAGFFCPICSLFYSDEKAMANHCKSKRHKQNTEVTHKNATVF